LDLQAQVDKAQEWAENPEDDPVETGQFSALHHAAKAAASASTASAAEAAAEAAQDAAETASLAAGAYPTTAAGLAATSNGDYFWAESGGVLTLYLNDGGSATSQSITLLAGDAFDTIWIPAIQMSELFNDGATLSIATNRLPVWLLDPDTVSYLGFPIRFPAHWSAFTCDFVYVNTTASSGDVSLGVNIDEWAIGETINTSPSGASITDTPSSTAWISNIATISGSINVDSTKYCSVRISRNATSGSDTLTNDIGLIGINLRKA
jgi:type II secretory pathway pseudopilin PulG